VFIWAIARAVPVLTQDSEDFTALHDLIMAAGGHHWGVLFVRFDNDPRHNLTDRGIVTALNKREAAGVGIRDSVHVLNHWR
jgi:hypothetical protein